MEKKQKKRIGPEYRWRFSTIADRNPEFLDYLRTNPLYEEALYIRRGFMHRLERKKVEAEYTAKNNIKPRTGMSLFNLKEPCQLSLIK